MWAGLSARTANKFFGSPTINRLSYLNTVTVFKFAYKCENAYCSDAWSQMERGLLWAIWRIQRNMKAATAESSAIDWMTYGLEDAADWADRYRVEEEFCLLIDVCGLGKFPAALGTVFHALVDSAPLLERWATEERAALLLHTLAEALISDPNLLEKRQPFRDLKPARQRFRGVLANLYLTAVLADEALHASHIDVAWWRCLGMWLLTHAVNRSLSGNLKDAHVKSACIAAYNASDNEQPWRRYLLNELSVNPKWGFSSLNRAIEMRANALLGNSRDVKGSTKLADLKEFLAVARFQHSEAGKTPVSTLFSRGGLLHLQPSPSFSTDWESEDDADDDTQSGLAKCRPNQLDADTFESDGSPDKSESENDRIGESILLFTAEQRQLLPWAWSTPNPMELVEIRRWIDRSIHSVDAPIRLLGVIAWMSDATGQGPKQVEEYSFSNLIASNWNVDREIRCLRRGPPMRNSSWCPKNYNERSWVRSVADAITVDLPDGIACAVSDLLESHPEAQTIGHLWRAVSKEPMINALSRELREIHPRLRPGMLASTQVQRWFEDKGDDAFARLMASGPTSGLPASCAYASWTLAEAGIGSGGAIALGSRLNLIEGLLVQSIKSACAKVNALREQSGFVEFHNAYTAYRVVQILGATAGRPVIDAFESPSHFDFTVAWLYLDDKASADLRQGRVVPLPQTLAEEIAQDYLRHLGLLANSVSLANPVLASEIAVLASGRPSKRLPFFYFLDQRSNQGWTSVSERAIDELGIFDWPLPLNLFRHRLAQLLRRMGLNAEIVSGLLGHAEAYAASYGDHSFRTWLEDMAVARPFLQRAYDALQFGKVSTWGESPGAVAVRELDGPMITRPFGIAARERARRQARISALRVASARIRIALGDRQLDELSEDEIYKLATDLLFNEKGMPTPDGHLRYSLLVHRIERLRRDKNKTVRLRKRFFRFREEASPFRPEAIGAITKLESIRNMVNHEDVLAIHANAGRPACAFAAAILLAITNRISNLKMLRDIAAMRRIRLVIVGGLPALEYGVLSDIHDPDAAVRRIPLTDVTACLLSRASGTMLDGSYLARPCPTAWSKLLGNVFKAEQCVHQTRGELLGALAALVDQANVLELPGIQAGVLAGRVPTFSPGWSDLVMLKTGQRLKICGPVSESGNTVNSRSLLLQRSDGAVAVTSDQISPDGSPELASQHTPTTGFEGSHLAGRRQAAHDLFKDVRKCLRGFDPNGKNLSRVSPSTNRRDIGRWLSQTLGRHMHTASSACILLGEWLSSMVTGGAKENIDLISIYRYASALTPVFEEVAYDANLLGMDEEDIVELYDKLLTARQLKAATFPYARLATFHRWAQRSDYGLPDIDWSDLPDVPDSENVLPGIIAESEYLEALNLINSEIKALGRDFVLSASFMLIGGYRFGLRRRESWGMLRRDFRLEGVDTVVLVCGNSFRKLKTRGSRRQVPLLFTLTAMELRILRSLLSNFESRHGAQNSLPILAGSNGDLLPVEKYSKVINVALKRATGNESISLHHARHSFANNVTMGFVGNVSGWKEYLRKGKKNDPDIVRILLGRSDCRRRSAWALARTLGHMGARTTFRNYVHLMDDWIASRIGIQQSRFEAMNLPQGFIDLDRFEPYTPVNSPLTLPGITDRQNMNFDLGLQVLRLLARGRDADNIALELALDPAKVAALSGTIDLVGKRLTLPKTKKDLREQAGPSDFLRRITHDGWQRLRALKILDTALPAGLIPLKILGDAVGRTRQIVMWDERSIALARWLVVSLRINSERYYLVTSNQADPNLILHAKAAGFEPESLKGHLEKLRIKNGLKQRKPKVIPLLASSAKKITSSKPSFQLDTVKIAMAGQWYFPESRCVLVFREQGGEAIRSSLELLAAALALSAAYTPGNSSLGKVRTKRT